MAKKIYVGNMSFQTNDDSLRHAFSVFGEIATCNVIIDRYTGSSKGFGFIEMTHEHEAAAAISGMNGQTLDGRQIRVSEASDKPKSDRPGNGNRW